MKNIIKDKVYKYVEKFLFENREIWNRFVFINENGVNKKISLMKLWDLIKTKKQYEDLEKLFWNEINKYYLEVIEINLKDNFNILMEILNFLQDNWFFSSIFFEVKGNLIFIFNKLNFLISNKEILELKNNDLWIDLPSNHLLVYEINSLFLLSFSLLDKISFIKKIIFINKTNFNELEIKKAKVSQKKFEWGFSKDNDYISRFDKSPLVKGIIEGRNILAHQLIFISPSQKISYFPHLISTIYLVLWYLYEIDY